MSEEKWIGESSSGTVCLNRLAFVHIPKTAGMSLHGALQEHFGEDSTIRIGNSADRIRFSNMTAEELANYRYISGHLSKKEMLEKSIDYPTVAVIRNPLDRLVSLLRYHRESELTEHQHLKFSDVKSFSENLRENGQFDMQCWHIAGTHKFEHAVDMIHKHCMFVSPLNLFADFLDTLSGLLARRLSTYRRNVTSPDSRFTPSKADIDLLRPIFEEDQKLFTYVLENYEAIKQNFQTYTQKYVQPDQQKIKKEDHS